MTIRRPEPEYRDDIDRFVGTLTDGQKARYQQLYKEARANSRSHDTEPHRRQAMNQLRAEMADPRK